MDTTTVEIRDTKRLDGSAGTPMSLESRQRRPESVTRLLIYFRQCDTGPPNKVVEAVLRLVLFKIVLVLVLVLVLVQY